MDTMGGAMIGGSEACCDHATDASPDFGLEWYAVQTKRRREAVAAALLRQRGLTSYAPQTVEWPPPAVGSPIVPLFPGYIFIQAALSIHHYCIIRTVGVKCLVCVGDAPARVDPSVIEYLQSQEDEEGIIHGGSQTPRSVEVEILKGPFRGLTALVEERLPARERVRVLLQLLQRDVAVEIPERWVRRA